MACDVEAVVARTPDAWRDLLGSRRALGQTVASACDEPISTASTRVWTAMGCLHKAGLGPTALLTLRAHSDDGWVTFGCGDRAIATGVARISGIEEPVVVAVLVGGRDARI